jgi:hypothetical protein
LIALDNAYGMPCFEHSKSGGDTCRSATYDAYVELQITHAGADFMNQPG